MASPLPRPPLVFQVEVDSPAPQVDVPVGEPVVVFAAVPAPGSPGPGTPFLVLTQAEFDALDEEPPGVLLVVI